MISRKQKYNIFFAVFIISIMVLSVLGYSTKGTDSSTIKYEGIKFVKTSQGYWSARVNNNVIYLLNNPKDLENISDINIDISKLNSFSKVYVSSNPEEAMGNLLVGFNTNIIPFISTTIRPACFVDLDICKNYPLKNCSSIDSNTGIILIKKSNINKIDYSNNCLTIQGDSDGIKKLIDKWVLELYLNGQ